MCVCYAHGVPYRGVYVRHVGRSEAVAEANQVLFFNRGEGYQISHPVAGGDACLSMVVAEPVRADLVAPKPNELRRRITPEAQTLLVQLRHRLVNGLIGALEAESIALALARSALGERAPRGTWGKRKLVERTKLVLASDLARLFQWRGSIDRLSADRRCIAPDSMGLGHTEVAAGQGVTPADQANMLAAFLDQLTLDSVDVIANDSGGAVAQLFVTRYPRKVRTLLLTNCDVEPDSPPAALRPVLDMAQAGVYPDLWLEPWLNHKDVARSAYGLGGMCYSNPAHLTDVALEQYLAPLVASAQRKALVNQYTLGLSPNPLAGIAPLLKKCTLPTRVVWGMSDRIFSTHSPDYLAGLFPRFMGIRRIPEAKLFFPEEYPDIIAAEARSLWERA